MPTPLSAATGGLRSCGPHQASVWACLPTAWQSLGRPKMTPGGQPDRRRRWKMPSPPCAPRPSVRDARRLSGSERTAHHMSSLIGSVGPNSIVSTTAGSSFFELRKETQRELHLHQAWPTEISDASASRNSSGASRPDARYSGAIGSPSSRGSTAPVAPPGETAVHERWAGGWTRW